MPEESKPAVWVGLSVKINTGNFENTDISMGVSGVPIDADEATIRTICDQANFTIKRVTDNLAEHMANRLREDFGR